MTATWHTPHFFTEQEQALAYVASQCALLAPAHLPTEVQNQTVVWRVWRYDGWAQTALSRLAQCISRKQHLCQHNPRTPLRVRVLQRATLIGLLTRPW